MDVSDASYYIQRMKITKIKVAKWGTPKKKIFKQLLSIEARSHGLVVKADNS